MITIKNLKKSFGNSLIFQNVNLDIEKGDAVVIIGGSGCGKSTFLRCINRLEQADEGQILINVKDILSTYADVEKIRRTMGMVYQSFNLFSHLNVMENMILAQLIKYQHLVQFGVFQKYERNQLKIVLVMKLVLNGN